MQSLIHSICVGNVTNCTARAENAGGGGGGGMDHQNTELGTRVMGGGGEVGGKACSFWFRIVVNRKVG